MEWTDYNENGDISFYEKYNKDKLSHEQKVFYYDSGTKKDELIIDQKRRKHTSTLNIMKMGVSN